MRRRKKEKDTHVLGVSLIIFLLDKLCDSIYNAIINGFFGYIFTAYSSELSAYHNGYVVSYFKGESKTRYYFRKIREYISKNFETSFILRKVRYGVCGFADIPLKTYGIFFVSFGIYTILVYFINTLLPITGQSDFDYLFLGASMCIVSLPMHFSKHSLAQAVKNSIMTKALFVDGFGYRDESFEVKNSKAGKHSGVAIILGLAAGMLTFVIHPSDIILFIVSCVAFALLMISPEIGVLITIFFLPFLSFFSNPAFMLAIIVVSTSFSYLIKLVRGKRIIKMELIDFIVLLFLILIYFSGAITVGGDASYYSAIISCFLMFGYFLVVNLIRTEKWLHRCILALISSGTVLAVIGIIQYILGAVSNNWLDQTYFSDIQGRTTSLFDNPNYLAAYLALIFPFAIYQTITCKGRKERLLCFISCLLIVICTVFTWCRAAWIAMILCTLIFCMIYTRKTLRYILLGLVVVPFLPFVLPDNVVSRFMSIGDMADSSTAYRVYTWKGSFAMLKDYFWSGIGYGAEAYVEIYPVYAYAGIETAVHSHSLYLQILIGMGIGGFVCFILAMLLYFQKSFEYLKAPSNKDSMIITVAAMMGVLSLLIMGLFDYVWYNYRIFFLFWAVLSLGVACIRIGKKEISKSCTSFEADDCTVSVDVDL